MIGWGILFSNYSPCLGIVKIRIVDGTLSFVTGKGTISISKNLKIKSIPHVPNFKRNLISVSKLS